MGETLRRPRPDELGAWLRRKSIYERHQAGETYPAIARDLGISVPRTTELAEMWKRALAGWERYQSEPDLYKDDPRWPNIAARYDRLATAGLLGDGQRGANAIGSN